MTPRRGPCDLPIADFCNKIGTELPTSAPQRFRPELGDQQTVSGRAREDRT
jgi:hypothetical protein